MHRPCKENTKYQTADQFIADHENLEQWFLEIAARAATGRYPECEFVWSALTIQLESHMDFEERELFASFAQSGGAASADTVLTLLEEHAAIRKQLESMEADLRHHLTQAQEVHSLLALLRAHASHEQKAFYTWLAAKQGSGTTTVLAGSVSPPIKGMARWRN